MHFNGPPCYLVWAGKAGGLGRLLEGGPALAKGDSVRNGDRGGDNKHGPKSLKRTGRRIKGFGLSRGAGAKKLSVHNPFDSGPLKCVI